jgi:predicted ATP-grasp superfamily ATP-dependent carboligase
MSIPDQKIDAVARVLSAWNPAAESSVDLDGYRTEAIDILTELNAERTAAKIIQQVISEAFNMDVSIQDCQMPAKEIWRIHTGASH